MIIKLVLFFLLHNLWVAGSSWFSLVGGTPRLATFLVWFYLHQARYVFRSAYWVNVFDKHRLSISFIGDIAGTPFIASFACFVLAFLPIVWRNKTLTALP